MKSFILTFILSFMSLYVTAQTYEIKGTVTDASGEPLPGVTVLVKNTTNGASTDFDGIFTIANVNQGDFLAFSSIGYATKEVVITNSNYLNVQLQEDTESLDEVVVVGYGTQRKELVSGAFSSIDSEKINESNPSRIEEALKGSSAGVQVSSNSGSPGAGLNIRIRGITTNGDNKPLVIVDGVNIGEDLSIIDPNDIEKMDIIKDASTAIYGVQGANGVILITTKKGRTDVATKFSYNTYYALQERANTMELMNATEYAGYINEAEIADGNPMPYTNISNYGVGTNWQNELFETAPMISHSLSATGGSEKVTYSFSGSLFDQEGVIAPDKSNFKRWTLKNNLGVSLTEKLKLNTLLLYTNARRKAIPENGRGSALYYALNASPLAQVYDGSDANSPSRGFAYIGTEQGQEIVNPMALLYNTYNETKVDRFTGKLEFVYDVIEGLKVTSR
ncbi:MAG TPA: SusC/RagA family TonB-linked outer membrane protein, partial [Flavobacteriaceae bacterium]|nr:SusC/RagA family TonB-linked outer membrane protein [Flavobacteriaceae bacterium]